MLGVGDLVRVTEPVRADTARDQSLGWIAHSRFSASINHADVSVQLYSCMDSSVYMSEIIRDDLSSWLASHVLGAVDDVLLCSWTADRA